MKIKNVSPLGDLDVPLLGRVVRRGETVDVPAEAATRLLKQEIWVPVDKSAEALTGPSGAKSPAPVPTPPKPAVDDVDDDDQDDD